MSAVTWVRGPGEHVFSPEALNNPDAGVLAVRVPPGLVRGFALGGELLRGLGKDETLDGVRHHTNDVWRHLRAWMLAHPIGDVLLYSAEHCRPTHLVSTAELVAAAGARLWLHTDGPPSKPLEPQMAAWAGQPQPFEQFAAFWKSRRLAPPALGDSRRDQAAPFPRVPREDFPTFRAACRDLLAPAEFARVDQRYVAAFRAAQQQLAEPTQEGVSGYLRGSVGVCASADELLIILRATQAALFRDGWLLRVALPSFLAIVEREPRAGTRTQGEWARLRPYADPLPGAITALRASGLEVSKLPSVTVGAIAPDGSSVRGRRETFAVERPAQIFLRAQRALRLGDGASGSAPLFWRRGAAISEVLALRALRRPVSELGVSLATATPHTPSKGWLRENGITLQALR
jgi:hypothetical protein